MPISKILIANRGEIAARIARTCTELGIRSVAVHSEPDATALHVRLADEAACVGGASPGDSYLSVDKVVAAALSTGCDAVHPGYGFLAENASFARAVTDAGLIFIGPPASAIDAMGEKVAARDVAIAAGVPVVPGSAAAITTAAELVEFGAVHGYPVAIKASYGGGGRGMRIVGGQEEAAGALEAAQRESLASFGRADVYLERYLAAARHVEVQVFADQHGHVVWLGDRDCSVQRRHQKLVEEAPAPGLSPETRTAMGEAAVRLARTVDYVGAGTVEFLVDTADEKFYFLEMNTRIQVEHPVTELVLGVDLIAEQLRVAAGEPLSFAASGPETRGHAIECRINAEDVRDGLFAPSPGRITHLAAPAGVGVRLDTGYLSGDEVLPYYDSLIAKLVVWAPTRQHAISRTLAALAELQVVGVPTTAPAAAAILGHPDFVAGGVSTRWLETDVGLASLLPSTGSGTSDEGADLADDDTLSRQEVWLNGRVHTIPFVGAGVGVTESVPVAAGNGGAPRRGQAKRAGARAGERGAGGPVTSPMQGTIVLVNVSEGQQVAAGDVLLVLEAMKMENPVRAKVAGTVVSLAATVGQVVPAGTQLLVIDPTATAE